MVKQWMDGWMIAVPPQELSVEKHTVAVDAIVKESHCKRGRGFFRKMIFSK